MQLELISHTDGPRGTKKQRSCTCMASSSVERCSPTAACACRDDSSAASWAAAALACIASPTLSPTTLQSQHHVAWKKKKKKKNQEGFLVSHARESKNLPLP